MSKLKTASCNWEGFKEEFLKCEGDEYVDCNVYSRVIVKEGWKAAKSGVFLCNLCLVKRMIGVEKENEKVRMENDRLKVGNDALKKELEEFKKAEERKVEKLTGDVKVFVDKKDEVNNWVTVARRLTKDNMLDRVDTVISRMDGLQREVRKQVKVANVDDLRCRRAIVFGMKESDEESDKEQVNEIIEILGGNVKRENVSDVIRMRATGEAAVNRVRPVIVEFKSEYDKWQFLRNKKDLKENDKYKRVFLEIDMSKEEREIRREKFLEKKRKDQ